MSLSTGPSASEHAPGGRSSHGQGRWARASPIPSGAGTSPPQAPSRAEKGQGDFEHAVTKLHSLPVCPIGLLPGPPSVSLCTSCSSEAAGLGEWKLRPRVWLKWHCLPPAPRCLGMSGWSALCSGVQPPFKSLGESRRCLHSDPRRSGHSNLTHRAERRTGGYSRLSKWAVSLRPRRLPAAHLVILSRGLCSQRCKGMWRVTAQDTFRGNLSHVFSGLQGSVAMWTDTEPAQSSWCSYVCLCRGKSGSPWMC